MTTPFVQHSARLTLRQWRTSDAQDAFEIWGDEEVMRHIEPPTPDVGAALRSLTAGARAFETHGVCLWPVTLSASGEVVGCCGFHPGDTPEELEIGYHIKRRHWGKGYATEAARCCLEYAFETLNTQTIVAYVSPNNAASSHVLEKLGFYDTGVIDEGERVYRLERSSWLKL